MDSVFCCKQNIVAWNMSYQICGSSNLYTKSLQKPENSLEKHINLHIGAATFCHMCVCIKMYTTFLFIISAF